MMNTKAHMTLLALEILGDSTSSAETTHTLDHPLSFKTATLHAVDVHAPGSALTQSWTTAQTGDTSGSTRTVDSPLYVDDGLIRAYTMVSSLDDGLISDVICSGNIPFHHLLWRLRVPLLARQLA